MTENSRKVFEFLKNAGAGVKFTTKEVQEALGFANHGPVTGAVNGLVKKNRAERFPDTKQFALTELGAQWDPDAEES